MYRALGLLLLAALSTGCCTCSKPTDTEQRASSYFDSVRQQPPLLVAFLRQMPKGGDLHNHLSGAIYAESLIDFAAKDGLCVERATGALARQQCGPCDSKSPLPAASCAYSDATLYNSMVDAWSMRNWKPGGESGHDHFFATFGKFSPATDRHLGDELAEVASRAAGDHLRYLELMYTPDTPTLKTLVDKVGWDDKVNCLGKASCDAYLATVRDKLVNTVNKDLVPLARRQLDQDEAKAQSVMRCDTPEPAPGCKVTLRYLYQVSRGKDPKLVFGQMLLGFELASMDSRFVGLNLVMPEDCPVCMRDFELHMHMLDYLHGVYPKIHIALHAGELAMGLVPPEGLRFHIRDSVETGHAERIGHGVDVMSETNPEDLLKEMAEGKVLVEICLTSNDLILGVRGKDHPFPVYRQYGVPVALATDDEGVSRSDMTHEYQQAVESYGLSYGDLKRMARQSLEHSFLPGESLWKDTNKFARVAACEGDNAGSEQSSRECREFLDGNQRAQMQWALEQDFAEFEKKF